MTAPNPPKPSSVVDELSSDGANVPFDAPRVHLALQPAQLLDVVVLREACEGFEAGAMGTVRELLDEHHALIEFVGTGGTKLALAPVALLQPARRIGWLRGQLVVPDPDPNLDAEVAVLFLASRDMADEYQVEDDWRDLVERGLRRKAELLRSPEFQSTAQAAQLLGIGESAVRKRIREGQLFALQTPGDGEPRIPTWALDSEVMGTVTAVLLEEAARHCADQWQLYHFFSTPHGSLNGLRPFECVLSLEHVPSSTRRARAELNTYLGRAPSAPMLDEVQQALREELVKG